MSNLKHTPAPWKVEFKYQLTEILDNQNNVICSIKPSNIINSSENTKLIASAPELLEALNLINLTIEEHFKKGGKVLLPSQIELAYLNGINAIKKATE